MTTEIATIPVADDTEDAPELTAKAAKAETAREEKSDLRKLEAVITKGDKSLSLMAEALTEIRDRRLYKRATDPETGKGYKAFAAYLLSHAEWGFTAQYANRLIANLRDQKAIEAGEEPETRTQRGTRELGGPAAALKIAKSFAQFAATIGKYRDAVADESFRASFDKMYGSVEKTVNAFVNSYPTETFDTDGATAE